MIVDSSVALAMINGFDGVKGRWKVNDFTAAPILNYAVCSHATETRQAISVQVMLESLQNWSYRADEIDL